MGKAILVIGASGSGKSTSIRNLDPAKTFIFSTLGKGLPFKGSGKKYTIWHKENNPSGNLVVTSSTQNIIGWLKYINIKRPEITTIVVDDNTFLPAKELDRRKDENGYKKYSDIAHDFLEVSELANTLRSDLNVYFLHHGKSDGDGLLEDKQTRAISFGKLIDEKLGTIEAQFEIVLLALKIADEKTGISYKFRTRDPNSTTKSPMGMFENEYIDNDLALVNQSISCYYQDDCDEPLVEAKTVKKSKEV